MPEGTGCRLGMPLTLNTSVITPVVPGSTLVSKAHVGPPLGVLPPPFPPLASSWATLEKHSQLAALIHEGMEPLPPYLAKSRRTVAIPLLPVGGGRCRGR